MTPEMWILFCALFVGLYIGARSDPNWDKPRDWEADDEPRP